MISGPHVHICEACVESAAAVLSALAAGANADEDAVGYERCGFCGKEGGVDPPAGGRVRLLGGPRTAICHKCVALCAEILRDNGERDSRAESLQCWVRHLSSPDPCLRGLAAVGLGDWGLSNEPAARQALVAALADTDWRVRALAEATLAKIAALPDGYHPSFADRPRRRPLDWMDLFFG